MRIGYLTYGLDRSPTGIGRYAKELLLALLESDHKHELIMLTTEKTLDIEFHDACTMRHLPGCRTLPALMTLGNLSIGRIAREMTLDVLHDPNGIAPFMTLPHRTAGVVTLHDAFPFVQRESHNWLDNWRYRWFLPRALKNASSVITVSGTSRHDLSTNLNINEADITVIPEGVSDRFSPAATGNFKGRLRERYGIDGPYVLYVGALNGRKNIARMLHGFQLAQRRHPDHVLVIAGKRQWKAESIDQAMQDPELQRIVHFTGYVPDEDLPDIYRGATAFLFPSLYEGFGLPVLEAMSCGIPIITSRISSLPEVAGDAAILVDPCDVREIGRAVELVLSQPELRSSLSKAGLARAARFSWAMTARQTIDQYEKVAMARSSSGVTLPSEHSGSSVNAD